jgi:hypothetical protein
VLSSESFLAETEIILDIVNFVPSSQNGRAVAQAVNRCLLTAAARVHVQAGCGICGEKSSIGAGFLLVLRFTLPIIPPICPSS